MSNQLSIPFKRTSPIATRQPIAEYIQENHADTHPDAFKWDVSRWEQLRKDGAGGTVHSSKVDAAIKYHAQLVFILTKLSPDIGLSFPYTPAFVTGPPESLPNLYYERAAVLFNLASLYSQLALSEDRSHADGIKRANSYYQNAAGALAYLQNAVVPHFSESLAERPLPIEFTPAFLKSLECLMLAQAQECAWQKAVMDQFKNGLIAKLSAKVSSFYGSSLQMIRTASPPIRQAFTPEWLVHIETKQLHFDAAAHYRKSVEDLEGNRYGHELARLLEAQASAKKGHDLARRGLAAKPVLEDIKSILDIVQKSIKRAERDNDLIYHQDVPSSSALPPIQEVAMVQSAIPVGLQEPKSAIGEDGVIFGDLVGWGARVAIEIYQDRRENWLKGEVYDRAIELDSSATQTLQSLHLPAALEALDKPIGLPPSLLKKAEEVRLEDGPNRIDRSIENVEMLAERNRVLLNEAMDLLDQEASEDEGIRKECGLPRRVPSYEANRDLTVKERRYRQILEQAAESDEHVRDKWAEWEETVVRLTWDEADLERWVPSSTVADMNATRNSETRTHARALRVHLEALDDVKRERATLVARTRRLADADDIRPRIMREAGAIERWTGVQPEMFEETIEGELTKYEKFKDGVEAGAAKQAEILEDLTTRNQQFSESRKDDKSVKDRELALQSLDLAYHKYREISRNLDEGLKFYNDLANILTMFREACKAFVRSRRNEMSMLTEALQQTHISSSPAPDPDDVPERDVITPTAKAPTPRAAAVSPTHSRKVGLELPPPDSEEWETIPAELSPQKRTRTFVDQAPHTAPNTPARRSTRKADDSR